MPAGCKLEAILPSEARWWEAFRSIHALHRQQHPGVFLMLLVPFWSPSFPPQ